MNIEKVNAVKNYVQNFDHKNADESISKFVQLLKSIDIKMVVFDFDLTIIGAHSGGYIDKTNDVDNIGTSVSEHFKIFSKALYANDIKITVATFSDEEAIRYNKSRSSNLIAGTELVQFCIKKSKCETKIEKVYAYYPYYYKEPKKYRALGLDKPMTNDKSYHLERIRREIFVYIVEIIFLGDDMNICISARKEGYITFNVAGKEGVNFKNIQIL
ncbi:p36 protein [Plasmodium falciparum IGH-CR14]|uniref:P36 protein n=1 Tax=Plasmodium falciparum IGH-CR14 TaxID=580059 RepID=A0A0L1I9N8_PLAFA|nr:p36 protein [Plasmodium falciparum IGH-CR14]